jgi:methyltransferase (TIGR00027 family)
MKLPNLSYMTRVGQLRYIQSHFESADRRNPDNLAGTFLSPAQRARCIAQGLLSLKRLRGEPFYYYVLARTKYYDDVFLSATYGPAERVINIGCGGDTRAYRFAHMLRATETSVLECDQADAIRVKKELAQRALPSDHVTYIALDLHQPLPLFSELAKCDLDRPMLVMMEGVSPYLEKQVFFAFLEELATRLKPGSRIAYDFKIERANDSFAKSTSNKSPFRLPADRDVVAAKHKGIGLTLDRIELSRDLCSRLVPGLTSSLGSAFQEDCLIQLSITPK